MAEDGTPDAQSEPTIRIVTMNIGVTTQFESDAGGTEIRKKRISNYWEDVKPDIVFAQNMEAFTIDNWKLTVPSNYNFLKGDKEAGIVYNSTVFERKHNIDAGEKNKIDDGFEDKGRLWAAILRHKESDTLVLFVSWNMKQQLKDKQIKQDRFAKFIEFVDKMKTFYDRKEYEYNIKLTIIGGKFNLAMDATESRRGNFKPLTQEYYTDYFMYKGLECAPNAETLVEKGSYANNIPGDLGYLDHDPVLADVTFTTERAVEGHDPRTLRLKMATMKMGHNLKTSPDGGGAKRRQEKASEYWNRPNLQPDIVFTQEIGAPEDEKWLLETPEKYKFLNSDNEAGIAYNSDMFQKIEEISVDQKKTIDETEDFANRDRLWAAVLSYKKTELTEFRVLCVSWHGPRIRLELKREQFQKLIRFVERMADDNNNHAILIGGDFNLDANETEGRRGGFKLLRPIQKHCIDYFLYKGLVAEPKPNATQDSYTDNILGDPGYLGHNPVQAKVYLDIDEGRTDTEE